MTKAFFITGTDTNIGKTSSIIALSKYIKNNNYSVLNIKPIATGCFIDKNTLYNSDGLLLQQASNLSPEYNHVNPYQFLSPVSPHIANNNLNNLITINKLALHCENIINKYNPDYCFIEGAGGWLCPLNHTEKLSELAIKLDIPVILIIGIKLGCLNHAMLTNIALKNTNIKFHGWIANCLIDPQNFDNTSNIDYLKNNLDAPLLGTINYDINQNFNYCTINTNL